MRRTTLAIAVLVCRQGATRDGANVVVLTRVPGSTTPGVSPSGCAALSGYVASR